MSYVDYPVHGLGTAALSLGTAPINPSASVRQAVIAEIERQRQLGQRIDARAVAAVAQSAAARFGISQAIVDEVVATELRKAGVARGIGPGGAAAVIGASALVVLGLYTAATMVPGYYVGRAFAPTQDSRRKYAWAGAWSNFFFPVVGPAAVAGVGLAKSK